jgi:hypothetical protein
MTTLSARKFNALQGADNVRAKLEKPSRNILISLHASVVSQEVGRKEPTTVILSVRQFREGACDHALGR